MISQPTQRTSFIVLATAIAVVLFFNPGWLTLHRPLPSAPCIPAIHVTLTNPTHTQLLSAADHAIRAAYPSAIASTTSRDFYTHNAPTSVGAAAAAASWLPPVAGALTSALPPGTKFVADTFDQLYISRPPTTAGDVVRYARHFDGVMRIPDAAGCTVCTVCTLVYLSGPTASFHAITSNASFRTDAQTAVLIDFNNEQHAVAVPPGAAVPRLALKAGLHAVKPGTSRGVAVAYALAHRLVFFVVKAVLEGTRRRETVLQGVVSTVVNNGARVSSNVYVAVPLLLVGPILVGVLLTPLMFPVQFAAYFVSLHGICIRSLTPGVAYLLGIVAYTASQLQILRTVPPRKWRIRSWYGCVGMALCVAGAVLQLIAYLRMGARGALQAWAYEDSSMGHPLEVAASLKLCGLALLCIGRVPRHVLGLVVMHGVWTWIVALFKSHGEWRMGCFSHLLCLAILLDQRCDIRCCLSSTPNQ